MNTIYRSRIAIRGAAMAIQRQKLQQLQQFRCLSINTTTPNTSSSIPPIQEQHNITTNQKRTFASKKKKKSQNINTSSDKEPWGVVDTSTKGDRMMDVLTRYIDADYKQPARKEDPPPSAEEMERRYQIGRNYNIGTSKEHNVVMHDLACKLKMKNHAMKMLPRYSHGVRPDLDKLREHALSVSMDDEFMPRPERGIPGETPPIPGFNMNELVDTEANK